MAFNAILETENSIAKITLSGDLDAKTASVFKEKIEEIAGQNVKCLVLIVHDLKYMASAGLRVLVFAKQKMGANIDLYVVGAQKLVKETIKRSGFHHSVIMVDEYEDVKISNI